MRTLFVIIVFIGIIMFFGEKDETIEQSNERTCNDHLSALLASQSIVKKNLKAPSTAQFPSSISKDTKIIFVSKCKHFVSSYVDAQNSFGAMLRSTYSMYIEYRPISKDWLGTEILIN